MNEQPTTEEQHEGPRVSGEQMRDLGALRRSTYDRHVAGVAGGLGRHLDVDPIILRVAFVVLTFFGGAGLIVYLACWLLVPDDAGNRATIHLDSRSRNVALLGVGVLAGLALIGDAWGAGGGWFPWPLFAIGLIAWVFLARKDRRSDRYDTAGYAPPAGTAPYPAQNAGTHASSPAGTYAGPPPGGVPTTPLPPMAPPPPRRPRDPRKRGPILFWFTLALSAVACGVLGILDAAGMGVADSAYPALVLGVIAVMLLVGAFFGRAGGLIFLGLVAAVVLSVSTIAERYDGTHIDESPTSASQLKSSYDIDAGEVELDLTGIRDLEELDGRTLDLRVEVGRVEVIVPRELHASVTTEVEIGQSDVFDRGSGGLDISLDGTNSGAADTPHLRIDADVEVGEVQVVAR